MQSSIHSTVTSRARALVAILLVFSSIAPGIAAAVAVLPAPASAAPAASAPTLPADPLVAAIYAHQFAVLQNPVQDPGFTVGGPAWSVQSGASIHDGSLDLPSSGASASQTFAVADSSSGAVVSPYTNFGALTFRATGSGNVTLTFAEDATGKSFGGVPVPIHAGVNRVSAASLVATSAGNVLYTDGTSSGVALSQILPQSHPELLTFSAGPAATIDDVVLSGVEYGTPGAHLDLGSPGVSDATANDIAMLQQTANDAGIPVDFGASRYAHDGYSLLVLPVDFTPQQIVRPASDNTSTLASRDPSALTDQHTVPPFFNQDPAVLVAQPGVWRFAVFLVEHAPSGARIVSPASANDARLLVNLAPTLDASGFPVAARGFVQSEKTPYASQLALAGLSGRGLLFSTPELVLQHATLAARWVAPANDGGLYAQPDVRGFFSPGKLAHMGSPLSDAFDAAPAPAASFAVGAIPCGNSTDLTFRIGNLDCDGSSDVAEAQCAVTVSPTGGVSVNPLRPDPFDPRSGCFDADGDGLVNAYDPQPNTAGTLYLLISGADDHKVWGGQKSLAWSIENTYSSESAQDPALDIQLHALFRAPGESGTDGIVVPCDDNEVVTSAAKIEGVCSFDTRGVPDGLDYNVSLVAEIAQGNDPAPAFTFFLWTLESIDNTPPVTHVTLGGTQSNGWYTSAVNVRFTTQDGTPGAITTMCALDGAEPAACRSLTIDASGQHTLGYWSVDAAGNAEAPRTIQIDISRAGPVVACVADSALPESGWYSAPVTVTCTATSNTPESTIQVRRGSGAFASYAGPFLVDGDGLNAISARGIDQANQIGATLALTFPIDRVAPSTTIDLSGSKASNGFYKSDVTVAFHASDANSGVADTFASLDGAAFAPVYGSLVVSADGTHSLRYFSVDRAGHAEDVQGPVTIMIDTTSPVTGYVITGTVGSNGWYRSALSVDLAPTDDTSGVSSTTYTLDGASYPYASTITVAGDARHVLSFTSRDAAGNAETPTVVHLDIDTTPPVVSPAFDGTQGNGGWYRSAVLVTVGTAPDLSGVAKIYDLVGSAGYESYQAPFVVSDQGLTAIQAYAIDTAGNVGPSTTTQLKIDSAAPVTTVGVTGPSAQNGWYEDAVQVSLASSDDVSGVDGVFIAVDGASFAPYAGPITVSGDGVHAVTYYATDVAGNHEAVKTLVVSIDGSAPSATRIDVATPGANGWNVGPASITLTPFDAASGIASTQVSLDGGVSSTTYAGPGPVTLYPQDGTTQLRVVATDVAGHSEPVQSQTLLFDTRPPVTHATLVGAPGDAGWFVGPVTLTLTAADPMPGSGVASTQYSIDGGAWTTYSAAIDISTEGIHAVQMRSTDAAGLVETAQSFTVQIDITPPATSAQLGGALGSGGWYTTPVTVTLSPTDATSHVARSEYSLDGGQTWTAYSAPFTVATPDASTVTFRSTDNAGLVETAHAISFKIDSQLPTTTLTPSGTPGNNGYFTSPVTVTLGSTGGPSGAAPTFALGDVTLQPYTGPVTLAAQGANTIRYAGVSGAGLTEGVRSATFLVDTVAPTTLASLTGTLGNNDFYTSAVSVQLGATDATSRVASTSYRVNDGAWTPYDGAFSVSKKADNIVQFFSVDKAGNTEATKSIAFRIDADLPQTNAILSGTLGLAGWYNSPVNVHVETTPGPSGTASTRLALDGAPVSFGPDFTVTGDLAHALSMSSTSGAGLVEPTHSVAIRIDTQPPTTTAAPDGALGENGFFLGNVSIAFSATDATSGVASTSYRVDGGDWKDVSTPLLITKAGTSTIEFASVDVSGLKEAVQTLVVKIDGSAPVTTLTLYGLHGANGWFQGNVGAQLAANGGPSGVGRVDYALDNGGDGFSPPGVNLSIATDGVHTLRYHAVSGAGVSEAARTETIKIDRVAPTSAADLTGTLGDSGYYTSPVRVALSSQDATSGVDLIQWSADGASWITATGEPVTLAAPGLNTLYYRAIDQAGNTEATKRVDVNIDESVPTVTLDITGTQGSNGWLTSPAHAALNASAGPSGLRSIEHKLDSAGFVSTPDAFEVATEGTHDITYKATSNAGLASTPAVKSFKIDTVPPVTSISQVGTLGANGWYTSNVNVSLAATDATSHVARVEYSLDGGANYSRYVAPFLLTASTTVTYRAVDNAGLVEVAQSKLYKIDGQGPTTAISLAGVRGNHGWYKGDVTVTLSASAGPSDVASTTYSIDGGPGATYGAPFTISAAGTHVVSYFSTTTAGVVEAAKSTTIQIDITPPVSVITLSPIDGANGWHTSAVNVSIGATDTPSGVDAIEYALDNGAWQPYGGAFDVSALGTHTVQARATDLAGNVETAQVASFKIDSTIPATTRAVSGTPGANGWFTTPPTVNLTATGGPSGVARIVASLDGGAPFDVTGPIVLTQEGPTTLRYHAISGAGLAETEQSLTLKLDTVDPVTSAAPQGPGNVPGWYTGNVTITLTPNDITSGPSATQYSADGGATWLAYGGPIVVSETSTILYRSVDNAGRTEVARSIRVAIDAVVPSTTATPSGTRGSNGWYTGAVRVTLTPIVGSSGVGSILASLDGAAEQAVSGPIVLTGDSTHTVRYHTTSVAGLDEPARTLTIAIDTTPPTTTASLLGTLGQASWYTSSVQVTLASADATSGSAKTEYSLDGNTWNTYRAPFAVSAQGATTVLYRATDAAGLVEPTQSNTFKIDTIAPTSVATPTGTPGKNGYFTSDVSVAFAGSDATSGLDHVETSFDGGQSWPPVGGPITVSAPGATTILWRAVDQAGLVEATHSLTVNVDKTTPVTSASVDATHGNAGWLTSPATVTLSATHGPSGAMTSYAIDGSAASSYAGSFPVAGDGARDVRFASVSGAGLQEAAQTLTLHIDTTPPVTSATLAGAIGDEGWYTSGVSVTLSAADATSGPGPIEYAIDGGPMVPYTGAFNVLQQGTHSVTYHATDVAGNTELVQTRQIRIDTTQPTVSSSFAGTLGLGGTYVSAVTVTLSAADATSGVRETRWSLDGANWSTYIGPFPVSAQGAVTVQFQAVDHAGLASALGSTSFRIDSVAPVTTPSFDVAPNAQGWFTASTVRVTLTPTDPAPGTGVTATTYSLDGSAVFPYHGPITVNADANHVIDVTSTDAAGNVEPTRHVNVKIDSVAPSTSATVSGAQGANGWFVQPPTVRLTAFDALSGVSLTQYRVNGGALQTYAATPITITGQGVNSVEFFSTDVAGNRELAQTQTLKVDTVAPSVTGTLDGTHGTGAFYRGPVTVTLTEADATSGPNLLKYSLDGGATNVAYTRPFTIAAEGATSLAYFGVDKAGLQSEPVTTSILIDSVAPTATASVTGAAGSAGWLRSPATLTIAASDAAPSSGIASIAYSLDNGAQQSYTTPVAIATPGAHTVTYTVTDAAGNSRPTASVSFKVDAAPPTTSASVSGTPVNGFYTSAVNVTLSATDATSGVAATTYRVNGGNATAYTTPIRVATSGATTIDYSSVDVAGNVETTKTLTVRLDVDRPSLVTSPFRTTVGTSTPVLSAAFGPVASGWTGGFLLVDGAPAPRCVMSSPSSFTISCQAVTWREAAAQFKQGAHTAEACAFTGAGVTWCTTTLLSQAWTFNVIASDWDKDGFTDSQEKSAGSNATDPYSTPNDPQGWSVREPLGDPTGTPVNATAAEGFLRVAFLGYNYASDPQQSFAPARASDVASIARLAAAKPCATGTSVSPCSGAGSDAFSVALLPDNTTQVTLAGNDLPAIPARATADSTSLKIRLATPSGDLALLDLGATPPSLTVYASDGTPLASTSATDSDGDHFPNDIERLLGSNASDAASTPVPRTEVGDGYALVMAADGTTLPIVPPPGFAQPIVLTAANNRFDFRLHVDGPAGRLNLAGARVELAFVHVRDVPALPRAPSANASMRPLVDTPDATPATWQPAALADWSLQCLLPACGARATLAGDSLLLHAPSNRLGLGPYIVWARVTTAAGRVVSGYYSEATLASSDANATDAKDDSSYLLTPVVLVSATASPTAADPDGDGVTSAVEISSGQSDPWDSSSTPNGDDDGDGVPNHAEQAPSWIWPTPKGPSATDF